MDDLTSEMRPGKPVSAKMRSLLDREKAEAKKRVIDRGIVHFRADKKFMEALLGASDKAKIAPGTLCRHIVWDRLQGAQTQETGSVKELGASAVNFEWGSDQLDLVQKVAAAMGVPPETYMKEAIVRQALKDLHDLALANSRQSSV